MSGGNEHFESILNSPVRRFFSHPAVGVAGSFGSVIGVALSVYFFQSSREKPELTCFVHPAKAAVVRTGQSSSLAVQFAGQELTSDITAAQVAFWNAGNKPIRASSILSPLVIRTANGERILEARLRKTSRDIVGITLDPARLAAGEVEVGWNILEQDDGGVLQIVYVGDEKVNIRAHAILEGQPEVVQLDYTEELRGLRSPGEEYSRRREWRGQLDSYFMISMGFLMSLSTVWTFFRRRRRRGQKSGFGFADLVMLAWGPVTIAAGIWGLVMERPPGPPFDF